jgi:uncharacterized glyoxalase superfamily protein PhnB
LGGHILTREGATDGTRESRDPKGGHPDDPVPDVRATAAWYETIGFTVLETFGDGGEGFAILSAGNTRLMLNQGGRPSMAARREVDLYVDVDQVDQLFAFLLDRVQVVAELDDTDYGMREFIIRDPNGFWITFGQNRGTS